MKNIFVQITTIEISTISNYFFITNQVSIQDSSRITSSFRNSFDSENSSIFLTTRKSISWKNEFYTFEIYRDSRFSFVASLFENRRRRMSKSVFEQTEIITRVFNILQFSNSYVNVFNVQQFANLYVNVFDVLQFSNSFSSDYEQFAKEKFSKKKSFSINRLQSSQLFSSLQFHFERIERDEKQFSAQHTRKINRKTQRTTKNKKKKSN